MGLVLSNLSKLLAVAKQFLWLCCLLPGILYILSYKVARQYFHSANRAHDEDTAEGHKDDSTGMDKQFSWDGQ